MLSDSIMELQDTSGRGNLDIYSWLYSCVHSKCCQWLTTGPGRHDTILMYSHVLIIKECRYFLAVSSVPLNTDLHLTHHKSRNLSWQDCLSMSSRNLPFSTALLTGNLLTLLRTLTLLTNYYLLTTTYCFTTLLLTTYDRKREREGEKGRFKTFWKSQ